MSIPATRERHRALAATPLPSAATFPGWRVVRPLTETRWWRSFLVAPSSGNEAADGTFVLTAVRNALERLEDREFARGMLVRAAEVGMSVAHLHLLPTLAIEREADRLWMLEPFIEADPLTATRPTSLPHKLWTIRQAAEALQALHLAGWLHGDVSAASILLHDNGHTTLAGLSNCRRLGSEECDVATTRFVGQVRYAPPEMFGDRGVLTAQADIYGLGAVLFELLADRPLLAAYEGAELIAAKRLLPKPDLSAMAGEVSFEMLSLLGRMLAREPLRRPTSAEVIEGLVACEVESLRQWGA